jgi:hypothetical protein
MVRSGVIGLIFGALSRYHLSSLPVQIHGIGVLLRIDLSSSTVKAEIAKVKGVALVRRAMLHHRSSSSSPS